MLIPLLADAAAAAEATDPSSGRLLTAVLFPIGLLMVLILVFKVQAFISLMIAAVAVGFTAGMPSEEIIESMRKGMGGTLGFVATIVGLGAIFGKILEASGGAEALARRLLKAFGSDRAPWAMVLTGFIISIPVFLDVALVLLVPVVYALARKTGRPVTFFALPLLAGLAVTHSFIPPTPGPVAVASILEADIGLVIGLGFLVGIPTAIVAGPLFGCKISRIVPGRIPEGLGLEVIDTDDDRPLPSFTLVAGLIGLPLVLMLLRGVLLLQVAADNIEAGHPLVNFLTFIGHPFSALIIATLGAWVWLGLRRGFSGQQLSDLAVKAMGPAGIIILITGAGGVFKEVLVDSGAGPALAESLLRWQMPVLFLGWLLAVVVRVIQGSATVAMLTAAGFVAPMLELVALSANHTALMVLAIAAGATTLSHVNDSGFWLVSRYLGLTEKETFMSWTVLATIVSVVGLLLVLLVSLFV